MPKLTREQPWEVSFRKQVKALAKGWSVKERHNHVRLRVRVKDQPEVSESLPYKWTEDTAGDAYTRIRNIYSLVKKNGHDLKSAAKIASGEAPKLQTEHDWKGAIEAFKIYKTDGENAIQAKTWDKQYYLSEEELKIKAKNIKGKMKQRTVFPVLNYALDHLRKGTATNPEDLLDACVRNWKSGSRSRQIAARSLSQFLTYCVNRKRFPDTWTPPEDLSDHIGRPSKENKLETTKGSYFDEDQILIDVINSIPDEKWSFAFKLIAELGLRPVELMHLQVKKDAKTKQPYWYCTYEKKAGKGSTKPRKLYPLKLKDQKGVTQEWDLLNKFHNGEVNLPDFENYSYGVADALKNYITRKYSVQSKKWAELKKRAKDEGLNLTLYSFRHTYSLRGHNLNIDGGSMSLAMGHNFRTHCENYPFASESSTDRAFAKAA